MSGRVSRIEQSIVNGTVTVDVALTGPLPPGSRADLSVDGVVQLEKLDNVMFVGPSRSSGRKTAPLHSLSWIRMANTPTR